MNTGFKCPKDPNVSACCPEHLKSASQGLVCRADRLSNESHTAGNDQLIIVITMLFSNFLTLNLSLLRSNELGLIQIVTLTVDVRNFP